MAKCGRKQHAQRVTLTFDDTTRPHDGQIVSGTNRPTAFPVAPPPFPVPAPPAPYNTNLATSMGRTRMVRGRSIFSTTPFRLGHHLERLDTEFQRLRSAASDLGVNMTASSTTAVVSSNVTSSSWSRTSGCDRQYVVLNDILPLGVVYISSAASAGIVATNGTDSSPGHPLARHKCVRHQCNRRADHRRGVITNTVSVAASTTDGNPTTTTLPPSSMCPRPRRPDLANDRQSQPTV